MTTPSTALRHRGTIAVAMIALAAVVTVGTAVLARATWVDRVPVQFGPSAAVVVVVWAGAAVLTRRWLRGGSRWLWAGIAASAGLGLAQLAFMDFGRPRYSDSSSADVVTFVVVVAVVCAATAVLGLLNLRPGPRPSSPSPV